MKVDSLTFLLIVGAAVVRVHSCGLDLGFGKMGSLQDPELCLPRDAEWGEGELLDYVPRNVYAVAVILIYLRVLQFLGGAVQTVGVLAIVLGAMKADVGYFFVILIVLTAGCGVGFGVLLRTSMVGQPWYHVLSADSPLWGPFWGVFGNFEVADFLELEREPTVTLSPVLLWVYLFIATVVLVNLLIAQMADTYGRVTADGVIRWQFERAAVIEEYKDTKPPLPPPLNLLCFAYYLARSVLAKCWQVATGDEPTPPTGFKKVPLGMQLKILERRENAALKEALRRRAKREEGSAEARGESLVKTLAKMEEQNRARFENMNGRLDAISKHLKIA